MQIDVLHDESSDYFSIHAILTQSKSM